MFLWTISTISETKKLSPSCLVAFSLFPLLLFYQVQVKWSTVFLSCRVYMYTSKTTGNESRILIIIITIKFLCAEVQTSACAFSDPFLRNYLLHILTLVPAFCDRLCFYLQWQSRTLDRDKHISQHIAYDTPSQMFSKYLMIIIFLVLFFIFLWSNSFEKRFMHYLKQKKSSKVRCPKKIMENF